MTEADYEQLDRIIKRLQPHIRQNFHGKVMIEVDYKNSVMGKQPITKWQQSHLVEVRGNGKLQ